MLTLRDRVRDVRRLLWVSVWLWALPLAVAQAQSAKSAGWKVLERTDEGFEIATREEAGRDLPSLRGRGTLKGDALHLLAIVLDAGRATEWAEGASRVKALRQKGVLAEIVYAYSELTWPVSDRDVITKGVLKVLKPGDAFKLTMTAVPDFRPKKKGVIRIKFSDSHFVIKRKGPDRVWVEYVVNVDPGGSLPKWLVRWAAKKIPGDTLRKLQEQLKRTHGQYDATVAKLRALQ